MNSILHFFFFLILLHISLHLSSSAFFFLSHYHVFLYACENLGGPAIGGLPDFFSFFFFEQCLLVLLRHCFSESGGGSLIQKAFTAFTHGACKSLYTQGPTSQRRGSEGRSSSGVTLAAE